MKDNKQEKEMRLNEPSETFRQESMPADPDDTAAGTDESAAGSSDTAADGTRAVDEASDGFMAAEGTEHHEEHHHHHHHHHRHHRTRFGRRMSKIKHFFKRNRRGVLIAFVVLLAVLVMAAATILITYTAYGNRSGDNTATTPEVSTDRVVLIQSFEVPQLLCRLPIYSYVDRDSHAEPRTVQTQYSINNTRVDMSTPITLKYLIENLGRYDTVKYVTLYVADNAEYTDALVYRNYEKNVDYFTLENLKTGTLYYCKVVVTMDDMTTMDAESYFYTVTSPRTLNLNGIYNARDIGGWMEVKDGKSIRQGLLYRGSEFDGTTNAALLASAETRDRLMTFFRIRTELDLRGADGLDHANGMNGFGDKVNIRSLDAPIYNEILYRDDDQFITSEEKARAEIAMAQIKEIFTLLADENNYPIYLHDTYGVDKVGTVCILLEALLGVTEQDIYKDYMMSAFAFDVSRPMASKGQYTTMVNALRKKSSYGNLQDAAQNYLIECGIDASQILKIQEIFLENAPEIYPYVELEEEGK